MEVSTDATPAGQPSGPPSVLYADLDGTVLGPGGSLFTAGSGGSSDAAARALLELRDAGVELVLMSGRTRRGLHETARVLGASGYIAELGSLVVLDGGREIIANRGSFTGEGRPVDAIARSGAGALLLERFPGRLAPVGAWSESSMMFHGHVDPGESEALLGEAGFGWLAFRDNGLLQRRPPELAVSEVHAYHLLPRGVTKASGVSLHRERIGVPTSAAAAIGDSPADLEVAAVVGSFFLVSNGRNAVREIPLPMNASVTDASHGDGFAEAVHLLLAR